MLNRLTALRRCEMLIRVAMKFTYSMFRCVGCGFKIKRHFKDDLPDVCPKCGTVWRTYGEALEEHYDGVEQIWVDRWHPD